MDYLCPMYRLLIPLLLLTACGKAVLVDEERPIPATGWAWSDTLSWTFDVPDTAAIYDLLLTVEHAEDYRFQNCYVQFHTGFPGGEEIRQVVSLDLQTPAGRWVGKCRGGICRYTIPIQQGAFFNQTGTHRLRLEQFMRADSLEGIRAMHLRIEDTGKRREG